MRDIFGVGPVLEQPEGEIADLGGLTQVKDVQRFGIPVTEFFQDDMFVAIHNRSVQI